MIKTKRFLIRELTIKDASLNYLNWLRDPVTNKFIVDASKEYSLEKLKNYISTAQKSNECLLLGFFDLEKGNHVGNIKFEPISYKNKSAHLGIFVGEKDYRGKGVAIEILKASLIYLRDKHLITKFTLGVFLGNLPAIKLYLKFGFTFDKKEIKYIEGSMDKGFMTLSLEKLNSLI